MSHKAQKEEQQWFVSVVVPVYNGRDTIGECIEALLAQNYPRALHEILVVDNNSTDGTDEIVKQYPVTLLYERQEQTSYAARNRGIRAARGDIVAFTDADCIAEKGWLQGLISPFVAPSVGAVAGSIRPSAPESLVERFFASVRPYEAGVDDGLLALLTGNVAYRKSVLQAVGMFDEALFTAGDVDLGWRVQIYTGAQVKRVPDAVVYHRHRTTLKGLFKQYRRYGFSEVLLDTLYRRSPFHSRTPAQQLRGMLRQIRALIIYVASTVYRRIVVGLGLKAIADRKFYVASPALFFVAESGALIGKCEALAATRGFRRNPFPSRPDIRRD
jgi:glycosyltransferase involved in cell wall biosynthesis